MWKIWGSRFVGVLLSTPITVPLLARNSDNSRSSVDMDIGALGNGLSCTVIL